MRFCSIAIALLVPIFNSHAGAPDPRFASAAWLDAEGVDPGPERASEAFKSLVERAGRKIPKDAKPRLSSRAEVSLEVDDLGLVHPPHGARIRTAVRRWTRAAKQAHSKSPGVRRTMIVGSDAIREALAQREAQAETYRRQFDEAPVGPSHEAGPSRKVLTANAFVAGAALLKIGGGLLVGIHQLRRGHYVRAGIVGLLGSAWAAPFLKISFDTLYVHAKQGLLNRGWIRAPKEPMAAWGDEQAFNERVNQVLNEDRRDAFAYRGARVKVDLRRTDAVVPFKRQPVPTGDDVFARAVARKGRVPAVDRRLIETDEVVYFDSELGDWVMIGVAAS